jgi:hypothetical protein
MDQTPKRLRFKIFVSYSQHDHNFATNVLIPLLMVMYEPGVIVYDPLRGDRNPWKMTEMQIENCDVFLALLSNDSLKSDHCREEYEEAKRLAKPIVPVVVRSRTIIPPDHDYYHLPRVNMPGEEITVDSLTDLHSQILNSSRKLLLGRPIKIFVSYSRVDQNKVVTLASKLAAVYDEDLEDKIETVWFDRNLHGGEDWWVEILSEIADRDIFIYLLSNESLDSPNCLAELVEADRLRKQVLPVLIRHVDKIPENIAKIQITNMLEGVTPFTLSRLHSDIMHLSRAIPRKIQPPLSVTPTPLPYHNNPNEQNHNSDQRTTRKTTDSTSPSSEDSQGVHSLADSHSPKPQFPDPKSGTSISSIKHLFSRLLFSSEKFAFSARVVIIFALLVILVLASPLILNLFSYPPKDSDATQTALAIALQLTHSPIPTHTSFPVGTPTVISAPRSTSTFVPTPQPLDTASLTLTPNNIPSATLTPTHVSSPIPPSETPIPTTILPPTNPPPSALPLEDASANEWLTNDTSQNSITLVGKCLVRDGIIQRCFDKRFQIDTIEVSNKKYQTCMTAGQCNITPSNPTKFFWNLNYTNEPVVNLSWTAAQGYCAAHGGRLPTDEEWDYAALGIETMGVRVGEWVAAIFGDSVGVPTVVQGDELMVVRGQPSSAGQSNRFRRSAIPADSREEGIGFRCAYNLNS